MVSGAGWAGWERATGRPRALTRCACRQQRGPREPTAVPEEERCTVGRLANLSYVEFIQ